MIDELWKDLTKISGKLLSRRVIIWQYVCGELRSIYLYDITIALEGSDFEGRQYNERQIKYHKSICARG